MLRTIYRIGMNAWWTPFIRQWWARRDFSEAYWGFCKAPQFKAFADYFAPYVGKSVMEFGCAVGNNLYLLAKRFPQIEFTGLDINEKAIIVGTRNYKQEKINNVTLACADDRDLPLIPNNQYEVVFTKECLCHIPSKDLPKVIGELYRIARKKLIMFELDGEPFSDRGIWIHDYPKVLDKLNLSARYYPYPKELHPVKPWTEYGRIMEIDKDTIDNQG